MGVMHLLTSGIKLSRRKLVDIIKKSVNRTYAIVNVKEKDRPGINGLISGPHFRGNRQGWMPPVQIEEHPDRESRLYARGQGKYHQARQKWSRLLDWLIQERRDSSDVEHKIMNDFLQIFFHVARSFHNRVSAIKKKKKKGACSVPIFIPFLLSIYLSIFASPHSLAGHITELARQYQCPKWFSEGWNVRLHVTIIAFFFFFFFFWTCQPERS